MFGIKVTIGSTLLLWLVVIASYYIFGEGYRELIHERAFMWPYTLVITFAAVFITAKLILDNTKLSKAETLAYLDRGWRVYGGTGLVFFLINLVKAAGYVDISTVFSLVTVAVGCAAFFVLKARQ